MPRKSTKAPSFRSETEEADWYATPAGRRHTQREFERSVKQGTLMVNSKGLNVQRTDPELLAELLARAKENATRSISLRVPVADIEAARRIGAKRGVGYQTVLKQAIHDGLKRRSA